MIARTYRDIVQILVTAIETNPSAKNVAASCLESTKNFCLISADTLDLLESMIIYEERNWSPADALRMADRKVRQS